MEQSLTTNTVWLLFCTALVFLMQAGFCCLESGLSRSKNSINVAIKNVVDFCIGSALFWLFGYALMFGNSLYGWVGSSGFIFTDSTQSQWPTSVFLFQMVFCATAMTIASGVVAERMRFRAYLFLAAVISGLIYPIFGHWAWGGLTSGESTGWLSRLGFIDFAGSTVVHSVGAWSALAVVIMLGPRIGRFEKGKPARTFPGSNLPMVALGVFMLWLGWFGFNGGSTLAMNRQVPSIILNTILAGVFGGLGALLWQFMRTKLVSVESVLNGVLAGLVGVTASCNVVSYPAAAVIGLVAAFVMQAATYLLESRFKIDDVVGAIPVHGCAGVWGTLAVALFAPTAAFGTGMTRWHQFGIQLLGVSVCFVWSFGLCWICIKVASRWISLRVSPEEEQLGLNVAEHGATNDLFDLLSTMEQNIKGDLSARASADAFTEAGMIAQQYNRVLDAEATANQKAKELSAFGRILDRSLNEIYIFDADTLCFVHVNHGAQDNIGYTMEELRGLTPLDLKPKYTPASFAEMVAPLLDGRQDNIEFKTVHRRKDGSQYPVEVHLESSTLGEKRVFVAIILDITQRQKIEEQLRRSRERALAADRAKSEFLANMSHEIRTPMTAILGFNDILLENLAKPENLEAARTVKKNGEFLINLIDDILDLSKIESDKIAIERIACSPHTIVADVVSLMRVRAAAKSLPLDVRFDGPIPETIQSDPTRLRQVLINVVGNAIKFTEIGSVEIVLRLLNEPREDPKLQFDVIDSGIGIAEDQLEKLFSPFTQADNSTTRRFGGSGLGLTISARLTELLGGRISVSSTVGKGSTFSITVLTGPLDDVRFKHDGAESVVNTAASNAEDKADDAKATLNDCRILLAEDGQDNQRLISFILKKAGAEVSIADNGQIAFDLATAATKEQRPFNVILMDMQMPVLDGYAATRQLRDGGYSGSILALTAHAMSGDREKCLDAGCDDYITKPVDWKKLVEIVKSYTLQRPGAQETSMNQECNQIELRQRIAASCSRTTVHY